MHIHKYFIGWWQWTQPPSNSHAQVQGWSPHHMVPVHPSWPCLNFIFIYTIYIFQVASTSIAVFFSEKKKLS
jgi:hypothetical protein